MNTSLDFDATQHDPEDIPSGSYEPLPPGQYEALVDKSEIKDTKKGGSMIVLTWKVLEGDYAGRLIWQNITWSNANEKAEAIGRARLSNVCHAVGKPKIADTADLHDIPCLITLDIEKGKRKPGSDDYYDDKNIVERCDALGAATPPPATAPKTDASGKPPWKR